MEGNWKIKLENFLEEVRKISSVNQEDLAKAIWVSRQTISNIENKKSIPSIELALKIASYFDFKVKDIFKVKKIEKKANKNLGKNLENLIREKLSKAVNPENNKYNIRLERSLVGITQDELAKAIGVSRQTIHSFETGKIIPLTDKALKMADYFGVEIEDMFKSRNN